MIIQTEQDMERLGERIGAKLKGGEIIELIGDVGAGKTTLTHGIARGLGIHETVQSPSFTISCRYAARNGLTLNHYDFYRLPDAGIMALELSETLTDPKAVTVIEWGETVQNCLPPDHIVIDIDYLPNQGRKVEMKNFSC